MRLLAIAVDCVFTEIQKFEDGWQKHTNIRRENPALDRITKKKTAHV